MRILISILLILTFSGFEKETPVKVEDVTYRMKAAFIYNFATLVDWPSNRKTGDFVIAVYGDNLVYKELKNRYSVKSVGSQKLKVVEYTSTSEIKNAHILFVGEQKQREVGSCKTKTSGFNTLLVSEAPGGLSKGAVINFVGPSGVNYEISKSNAKKNKLVIASRLVNLAKKVE